MRVLLTGGSGFIAAHCVDYLLQHGHSVVFTVRSDAKGEKILKNHPSTGRDQLSYVIVEDIAVEGAFDQAVKSNPPFEAVLHTASPFHFNVTDPEKDLLNPALIGTTGILKAIKANAPTVKRVVITSSFAAIVDAKNHPKTYDESNWNPVTWEEAHADASTAYRGSKTFAEKAAWKFLEEEKPNFTIATINPPLVFGPVVHYLNTADAMNTSNERIRDMVQGKYKENVPPSNIYLFVDVRDVALSHVKAMEVPEAGGKRFFCVSGYMSNGNIASIIKKNFPQLADKFPDKLENELPKDVYGFDNSRTKNILGINYRTLDEAVIDTTSSILPLVQ